MKDDFSVLIQNRTEFEKGNPATVFLSLPATKEELHEAMKALNITADNPQDFFLNGYSTADIHLRFPRFSHDEWKIMRLDQYVLHLLRLTFLSHLP